MNPKFLFITVILLIAACSQPEHKPANTSGAMQLNMVNRKNISVNLLINPGGGIGKIRLKESTDSALNILGKPDKSDAAMGASMMTWYSGHDTSGYVVTIYAHHQMGSKDEMTARIKQIRVTSPDFQTADQLHTGSALKEISRHYKLKPHAIPGQDSGRLYDDAEAGIAFEIDDNQRCDAIIIHEPKDSLATYLNIR